ncbi:hypothetical protein ACGFWI_38545 [Streptomyces sp. NPDC048434]|uniref:hypothetical protein n=1 Tax=Streptomyces sp. NPDC048434 TaxID=3365549 RepID=UPI003721351A
MYQSVIAGLGNLLCDEILWRACVSPRPPARDLGGTAYRSLHAAMGRVLRSSVRAGCVPPRRSWLTARRETASRCARAVAGRCSSRTAGRPTVWCPRCQP